MNFLQFALKYVSFSISTLMSRWGGKNQQNTVLVLADVIEYYEPNKNQEHY